MYYIVSHAKASIGPGSSTARTTGARDGQANRSLRCRGGAAYPGAPGGKTDVANGLGRPFGPDLPAGSEVRERHQPRRRREAQTDSQNPRGADPVLLR